MMQKLSLGLAFVAGTLALAPSAYAVDFGADALNLKTDPDGTISATFGNSGIVGTETSDTYSFALPIDGIGSGSVTTNANVRFSATDLDIISVVFNGSTFKPLGDNLQEVVFFNQIPITAGATNTMTINYVARGNGSYGGQASFTPTPAVPEPATWAMLILGFFTVGYAMRRRTTATIRFAQAI